MSEIDSQEAVVESPENVSDEQYKQYFETEGNADVSNSNETNETNPPSSDQEGPGQEVEQVEPQAQESATQQIDPVEQSYKNAFAQERKMRQQLEQQIQELQSDKTQTQEEPEEDDIDPLEKTQQDLDALKQQIQQQQTIAQVESLYNNSINQFAAKEPKFVEAFNYARESRAKELQALGYEATQVEQVIQNEHANFVYDCVNRGVDPASTLFNWAKARGYDPDAGASIEQKFEKLQAGVNASKSLSNTSGTSSNNMDLNSLVDADSDTFKSEMEKMIGGDGSNILL